MEVELPAPTVLVNWNGSWGSPPVQLQAAAVWHMPAGNTLQGPVVAAVTVVTVLGCAAAVLGALLFQGHLGSQKDKRA